MTTQMLIYERAAPITVAAHKDTYVKTGADFGFASKINAVPLMATEFISAAKEFAVVFAGTEDKVMPTAVLGVRNEENLFVNEDGSWDARYRPAFLRQYPFVFAGREGSDQLTLCIDEQFKGVNKDGRGERLFDADGNRTAYLNLMLDFAQKYQGHFRRTEIFCQRLKEHGLLEPMQAKFTLPDGQSVQLAGFWAVNREKVKQLDGDTLKALAQTDELELIYVHLQSMQNLDRLIERLGGVAAETDEKAKPARKNAAKARKEETEIDAS
ncbi:SapC family protein [Thetidibacter halocola]|uniref:SapC family protein n=1 Tax=Thetidibacter halocola TaxID=2827239 RepID=A0A8J7WK70_9RHOB|nr:SapC family protein [Thetidibacter halocola]MBS0126833.1 SapC family protein [Thetidibacter halocola]